MISLREARKRVPPLRPHTRVDETSVDRERAWFFAYVPTSEKGMMIGGRIGVLVDKRDGSVHEVSHAYEVEAYDAGLTERSYDVLVDEVHDLDAAVECLRRLHMLHLPPPPPGDIPRVQVFDMLWLEAHLGHAPCSFELQDLRPWFREVRTLEQAGCVAYRLAPSASFGRRSCPTCVALGRDPALVVAGFDCPCCEYATLSYDVRVEHERGFLTQCPICGWQYLSEFEDPSDLEAQRATYRQIGAVAPRLVGRLRAPNPAEIARRRTSTVDR